MGALSAQKWETSPVSVRIGLNMFFWYRCCRAEEERCKKMSRGIIRDQRGLSSVISTVILVSVTAVVGVAFAHWPCGFLDFGIERIEITYCYVEKNATYYTITVELRNSGSEAATLSDVLVNGKSPSEYGTHIRARTLPQIISPHTSGEVEIDIDTAYFDPGTAIGLMLCSTSGNNLRQTVILP